jgi:recombination protein RecA
MSKKVITQTTMNLDDFVKWNKKEFGKDSITVASTEESWEDFIPVTPKSLANALGIGGYALGKIHTIDGEPSGGKSTLSYDIIANSQIKFGKMCLLIDKENSYTKEYGAALGIDNDKLLVSSPKTLEDMYEVITKGLETNQFGVIVVDSVTSFAPQARYEGSEQMGIEARVNSDKMRLINDAIKNKETALVMIQQIRQKIGGFGDPNTVSGGLSIPFYAHTRTRITRSSMSRDLQQNVMKFTIIKNKLAIPYKVGTVVYQWGKGFDLFSEYAELAVEFGIIRNEKTSYYLPDSDEKIIGKKKLIDYLEKNADYTKAVLGPLVDAQLMSSNLREDEIDEAILD